MRRPCIIDRGTGVVYGWAVGFVTATDEKFGTPYNAVVVELPTKAQRKDVELFPLYQMQFYEWEIFGDADDLATIESEQEFHERNDR